MQDTIDDSYINLTRKTEYYVVSVVPSELCIVVISFFKNEHSSNTLCTIFVLNKYISHMCTRKTIDNPLLA